MEVIEIGGIFFPIVYRICACHVWPIVLYNKVGRCGNCGQIPEGNYESRAAAQEHWNLKYD